MRIQNGPRRLRDKTARRVVACWVLKTTVMIIEVTYADSQEFDDGHFFSETYPYRHLLRTTRDSLTSLCLGSEQPLF
jgi:hypothetical protein